MVYRKELILNGLAFSIFPINYDTNLRQVETLFV